MSPGSHGRARRGKERKRHASSEGVGEGEDGREWESASGEGSEDLESDREDSGEECSGSDGDDLGKAAEEEKEVTTPIQVRGHGIVTEWLSVSFQTISPVLESVQGLLIA